MDNILNSKLYRPGSVGYVSKSGGMSNELNNIISRNSNGVAEGSPAPSWASLGSPMLFLNLQVLLSAATASQELLS